MDKDYYKILEIDQDASEEIIEKAYKTLVKKYHPDLQNETQKTYYEEKMKQINEAYAVLSDENAREEYDKNLENDSITKEEYEKILRENSYLREKIKEINENTNNNIIKNNTTNNTSQIQNNNIQAESLTDYYMEKMNRTIQQAYQDAYIQDMKNRGYRFTTKHTFKEYLKAIITMAVILLVIFLIAQIPFIKKYLVSLYEQNEVLKAIIDMFVNTFKQFFR